MAGRVHDGQTVPRSLLLGANDLLRKEVTL